MSQLNCGFVPGRARGGNISAGGYNTAGLVISPALGGIFIKSQAGPRSEARVCSHGSASPPSFHLRKFRDRLALSSWACSLIRGKARSPGEGSTAWDVCKYRQGGLGTSKFSPLICFLSFDKNVQTAVN